MHEETLRHDFTYISRPRNTPEQSETSSWSETSRPVETYVLRKGNCRRLGGGVSYHYAPRLQSVGRAATCWGTAQENSATSGRIGARAGLLPRHDLRLTPFLPWVLGKIVLLSSSRRKRVTGRLHDLSVEFFRRRAVAG